MTRAFDPSPHHAGCPTPPGNEAIPFSTAPMMPQTSQGTGTGNTDNAPQPVAPTMEATPPMPSVPGFINQQKTGCGPTFPAVTIDAIASKDVGKIQKTLADGTPFGDPFDATNIGDNLDAGAACMGGYDASCSPFCL